MTRSSTTFRQIARELRRRQTPAERLLWERLRNRKLQGLRFVRQHPIGRYIVDFYCPQLRLVIELEGNVHDDPDQQSYDDGRFAELQSKNLRILRIRNSVVINDLNHALKIILSFKQPPP